MQDESCKAVLAAVILTHLEPKEKHRCFELVDHFKEVNPAIFSFNQGVN